MYDRRDLPNSHYEKFTLTGEVKCVDDEIPFDLPKGWEWCRFGEISTYAQTKKKINASNANSQLWRLDLEDIERGGRLLTIKTVGERKAVGDKTIFNRGDILYSKLRPYLLKILVAPQEGICTPEIIPFTCYGDICNDYIVSFLKSPYVDDYINAVTFGVKMPRVGTETIISLPIPLPPLSEQQRIVEKIEELMPLVEQYGKAQSELEALNSNIRERLKKSVLQYAIEGKLEPQCEEDGTAEDLLREIQAEKQRLYAEGKLKKKDLAHSTIFRGEDNKYYEQIGKTCACIDNQIPFEIPLSWRWVRIKDIVKINPKNERSDDTIAAFIPMEKIEATFLSQFSYTKVHWDEIKSAFTHFADGDIAFAKISPCFQNRKSMVLQNLPNGIGAGTTELKVLRPYGETIQPFFLMYFLETSYFVENASFKGTANQQRILVGYLENKLLPLPPLREQRQISNTITDFLHLLG